jgi:hypothetical protein
MNRLRRVEKVPARSMETKGLRAKSWKQRSCGVEKISKRELLEEVGGIGGFPSLDIRPSYIISLSKVKGIVRKFEGEFQNRNCGRRFRGRLDGFVVLAPAPYKIRKERGTCAPLRARTTTPCRSSGRRRQRWCQTARRWWCAALHRRDIRRLSRQSYAAE